MIPKQSQFERCCLNCRYSHQESHSLLCFGEKEAPPVRPDDICDAWMPTEDAEGWRNIALVGLPSPEEEVIIYTQGGTMAFAKFRNTEHGGDYWILRGPYDIRHYISTNWVTHWKPKPKKPVM